MAQLESVPKKITILLVDDNPSNLLALEAVLGRPDYTLLQASSGEEALALLHVHPVALILLDVQMPGMDGYETARLIKAFPKFSQIPIIFISAVYTEDEFVRKGYEAGGVDYFGKPFNTDALKLKVGIYAELYEKNIVLRSKEKDVDIREAELNAVLESIPDPIYVVDLGGLTRCNKATLEFFGLEPTEEPRQSFDELLEKIEMEDPSSGKPILPQDLVFSHALKGKPYTAQILVRNRKTQVQKMITVTAGPIFFEGKTILVIEDDHDTRVSVRQNLEREGYFVFSAANGVQGLELLKRIKPPCLILLDIVMPLMNGEEFMKLIESDPVMHLIPVVLVSAFPDIAKTLVAKEFLQKPINLSILLDLVNRYCPSGPQAS